MQRIESFAELKFQTHDDDWLAWPMISHHRANQTMRCEGRAADESGALEVAFNQREELKRDGESDGERWSAMSACPTARAKRGAVKRRPCGALGLHMKAGKPSQRGKQPLATRSPLGSCGSPFIVPSNLSLAQHTLNTDNSLLLLSASYTYGLHFTPYLCCSISTLDSPFHSIQNGSSHICSFWVRCRSTLECHQVIIVRSIGCCPCAVRPCPQCKCERQPCCGC